MYKIQAKEMLWNNIPSDELAAKVRQQLESVTFYNDEDADDLIDWIADKLADEPEPDLNEG